MTGSWLWLAAAPVLLAAAQVEDRYAAALTRCEADYAKRSAGCRRAEGGNYRCLQATLDRLTLCRDRAEAMRARLGAPPVAAPPVRTR